MANSELPTQKKSRQSHNYLCLSQISVIAARTWKGRFFFPLQFNIWKGFVCSGHTCSFLSLTELLSCPIMWKDRSIYFNGLMRWMFELSAAFLWQIGNLIGSNILWIQIVSLCRQILRILAHTVVDLHGFRQTFFFPGHPGDAMGSFSCNPHAYLWTYINVSIHDWKML